MQTRLYARTLFEMKSCCIWKCFHLHQCPKRLVLFNPPPPPPPSECVETPQPPVAEESVRPPCRVWVVSSSWCAEIGQHGPAVLPLCCSLAAFLIIIPGKRGNRTDLSFLLLRIHFKSRNLPAHEVNRSDYRQQGQSFHYARFKKVSGIINDQSVCSIRRHPV